MVDACPGTAGKEVMGQARTWQQVPLRIPQITLSLQEILQCSGTYQNNHLQMCLRCVCREAEAQGRLWLATGYFKLNQTPQLVLFLHLWAEKCIFLAVEKNPMCHALWLESWEHERFFKRQKCAFDLCKTQEFGSLCSALGSGE